jgi:hypothetical protein
MLLAVACCELNRIYLIFNAGWTNCSLLRPLKEDRQMQSLTRYTDYFETLCNFPRMGSTLHALEVNKKKSNTGMYLKLNPINGRNDEKVCIVRVVNLRWSFCYACYIHFTLNQFWETRLYSEYNTCCLVVRTWFGPPANTQHASSVIRFPIPHKRKDVQTSYSGARKSTRYLMSWW